MKYMLKIFTVAMMLVFSGCSGSDEPVPQDNVFKETTDTIDRAKEAEEKMLEAAKLREEEIKKQTQ